MDRRGAFALGSHSLAEEHRLPRAPERAANLVRLRRTPLPSPRPPMHFGFDQTLPARRLAPYAWHPKGVRIVRIFCIRPPKETLRAE